MNLPSLHLPLAAVGPGFEAELVRFDLQQPLTELQTAFSSIDFFVWGIAFLFSLIGFYSQVWRRRAEPVKAIEAIGFMSLYILFAAAIPFWKPIVIQIFYFPAEELARQSSLFQVNLAINNFWEGLKESLTQGTNADDGGVVTRINRFIWNLGQLSGAALLGLLFQIIVSVLSVLGGILILPFYFVQRVLSTMLFVFMPAAICALGVPALKDKAVSYMSMTASVLAWPLGFSIVAAATNLVFQVPFDASASPAHSVTAMLIPAIKVLIAAIIMVVGTLLVPPTLFYIFLYGGTQMDPIMSAARSVPMLGGLAKR